MESLEMLRSMLFVPANNWRLIQSAMRAKPDAVILDLEDAVPIEEKETARWFAKDAIELLSETGHNIVVRVNGLSTGLTIQDLEFSIQEKVSAIMLPKSESREEIREVEKHIERREKEKGLEGIGIIPLVESAKGIMNVFEIAHASVRVSAMAFGAADYMRDFGRSYFTLSVDESELLFARSRLALSARISETLAIDTPFLGSLVDREALVRESKAALRLGFKGKMCIHPMHIDLVNGIFSPTKKDVDLANRIVLKYEDAKAKGYGATSLEGRMIDEATYRVAKDTLKISETIAEMRARRGMHC